MGRGNYNNRFDINSDNYNNRASRGIDCLRHFGDALMKTYRNLYEELCSFDNLRIAYVKARQRKKSSSAIMEFAQHWQFHLWALRRELRTNSYRPQPLQTFILRDPKTRRICVSEFRDRIVHHALVNILQPIFEPRFIADSYASRKGKGTLHALQRADIFIRKVTKNGVLVPEAKNNNQVKSYALKCDIKHYFDAVDHNVLLDIFRLRIKDKNVLWLITLILKNYHSGQSGKGMPLGNWTSQFFANVYLNELDQFVKHQLHAKWYIRYVDDFVIFHLSKKALQEYEQKINEFLSSLRLELHPDKCRIVPLSRGLSFLGFRVFYQHKLVRKRNLRVFKRNISLLLKDYKTGYCTARQVFDTFSGWKGYALLGNSHRLCQQLAEWLTQELTERTAASPFYAPKRL